MTDSAITDRRGDGGGSLTNVKVIGCFRKFTRFIFRPSLPTSSGSSKRYYFEHLQLNSTQLKLSVSSAGRLPEDLQSLKSSLGLILFNLEDATVDLGWCTNLDIKKILPVL